MAPILTIALAAAAFGLGLFLARVHGPVDGCAAVEALVRRHLAHQLRQYSLDNDQVRMSDVLRIIEGVPGAKQSGRISAHR